MLTRTRQDSDLNWGNTGRSLRQTRAPVPRGIVETVRKGSKKMCQGSDTAVLFSSNN